MGLGSDVWKAWKFGLVGTHGANTEADIQAWVVWSKNE